MNWKLAKIVRNRIYKVEGINLFDVAWQETGETVKNLKDVIHGQRFDFPVYTAQINGTEIRFAVKEVADEVFVFYIPE